MAHQSASIVDVWTAHSWLFSPATKPWKFVVQGGHEPRLEKFGKFRIIAGSEFVGALSAALLTVTYHYKFRTAKINCAQSGVYDYIYSCSTVAMSTSKTGLTSSSNDQPGDVGANFSVNLRDTDYDVNGSPMYIPRSQIMRLASSLTTAAADSTSSSKCVSSPQLKATKALLISTPPGYYLMAIDWVCASGGQPDIFPHGGYAAEKDASENADGTLVDYYEQSVEAVINHQAYNATSGSMDYIFRSSGLYSTGLGQDFRNQLIVWSLPLKGILITMSTAFDQYSIRLAPISRIQSWTNNSSLASRINKLERFQILEEEKGKEDDDESTPTIAIVRKIK
jgi:hypothetical protein